MKLGDIFKLSSGKSLPEKKRISGECNVYGGNGITGSHNDYFVEEPTIVIGRVGEYCGAVHLTAEKCWVTDNALMVTEWYQEVDKEYMTYALNAMNLHQYAKTVGQPSISQANVYTLDIELPSIEQQREIVKILNVNKNVLVDRQHELELLDDLIKARFVELFGDPIQNPKGWEKPLIEEVVANEKNALKAGPFGSALKKEYYVESGYKIYGQEQVISGDHTFGDYYIDEERYKSLENCAVQAGDVLISLVGTYGKLLIMPEIFEPGIINPRLMKITFDKDKVNPYYFKFFFQSESLKKSLAENTHGGTMDILNLGIVRKIAMPLPPLELQDEFVLFVKQVDKSKFAVQKALDETQTLFDSLMQRYFG